MDRQQALDFVLKKNSWVKKPATQLRERLKNIGINVSLIETGSVQQEARKIIKEGNFEQHDEIRMKIRRKWITPEGKVGFSYERDEDQIAFEDIEAVLERLLKDRVEPYQEKHDRAESDLMLSVFTSDKHIGARTATNSMYENKYDRDAVFERHGLLVDRIMQEREVFGKFDTFVMYDLGDPLDGQNGQTTRGGHILPQNMDDREQVDCFVEVTIKTMETVITNDTANNYKLVLVSNDNHTGSFGYGALLAIKYYLELRHANCEVIVSSQLLDHIIFGEHAYIYGHGKDERDLRSGMPLNLNDKTEGYINDYIDRKKIRSPFIHVVKGDLHQSAINYAKRFRYKNNMSMYGASGWIHNNFGSGNAGVDYEITDMNSERIYESRITFGHDS